MRKGKKKQGSDKESFQLVLKLGPIFIRRRLLTIVQEVDTRVP
jgi:hypothetical protein